ncbi:flavodoxin [Desulfobulbus propionicus]
MAKALIVYGSTTGNTENTAKQIAKVLAQGGHEVVIQDVRKTKVEELGNGFDLTLLGSSTWGDSEIELQEDFASFFEEMDKANLRSKKLAVFGCGDSSYPHFCGAVDQLREKIEDMGGVIVNEPLKIDGDPGDAAEDISGWAHEVAASF